MTALRTRITATFALFTALLPLAACSAGGDQEALRPTDSLGAVRLVAFDSCAAALDAIRAAARAAVGPYGFNTVGGGREGDLALPVPPAAAGAKSDAAAVPGSTPTYSGTNNQEVGVDEPDLVKTDGRRIITVHNGTLTVVDAASRQVTGTLALADPTRPDKSIPYGSADLLLAGDHALVLNSGYGGVATFAGGVGGGVAVDAAGPVGISGGQPELTLVDLSGTPRVLSRLRVDGGVIDARQTGTTARVIVRSSPRFNLPALTSGSDAQRVTTYQKIIDQAGLEYWLPRIEVTTGATTDRPEIGCDDIVRPDVFSGTNMLTILTLDLGRTTLADPAPVSLLADGETVYSNGTSLYVASDSRWRTTYNKNGTTSTPGTTSIYRFDTSRPGRPPFVAGGRVPGHLVNQYALSERDGDLRVATTTGDGWSEPTAVLPASDSGVYVLRPHGATLDQVGKVTGLGKGERIYAVRYVDSTAYVVTFRQTDPLYIVDLSDPAKPTVRGELKITGYSSYLHPAGPGRLLGIGQDVNAQVRAVGTQVSLFDVSNPGEPARLATFQLQGGSSEAEYDPHAFLYWAPTGLLVVPTQVYNPPAADGTGAPATGVTVLHVGATTLTPLGAVRHPATTSGPTGWPDQIRRSMIIDGTLWTVSDGGLMASDPTTLVRQAWIPLA